MIDKDHPQPKKDQEQEEPVQEAEDFRTKAEEYLNGWKRCLADFDNYRKDEGKRIESVSHFRIQQFLKSLIVVLDSFDESAAHFHDLSAELTEGLFNIKKQLEGTLFREGLEVIGPGEHFDPAIHEALDVRSSDKPEGTILEVKRKGYRLKGMVIRPVGVVVAGKTYTPPNSTNTNTNSHQEV